MLSLTYVPPPQECAVLVVERDGRWPPTPFADHVLQSNSERRRNPARPPAHSPAWSLRYGEE